MCNFGGCPWSAVPTCDPQPATAIAAAAPNAAIAARPLLCDTSRHT
jgi:hypothetical protein